jgi:type I restriction enzyme S subunit
MSDWQKTTFGKVSTGFLSGGTPTTSRTDYWKGEIPWITSKWLGDKLELTTGEKFVSEEAVKKSATKIVPKDSIIFATRVGVGKVGINRIDLAINQDLAGVLIDNEKHDIKFLAYQLGIDSIQQYVAMNKRGATIKGITRDCLEQIRLNVPPLPEQKKIAHILSTVQRAIEAQERIIQTTTELKKALMHKLFTEGLRQEPQKQTEIGPVPESWEVVELGTLAKVGNGSTPKRANKAYWEGGTIPWLNSTKIHDRFITEADQFVTPQAVKECHLPKVLPNSLLIAITGQGKTLGNSAITRIATCINQHLAYAQFHAAKIVPDFVLWFMHTRYDYLRSIAHGGGSTKGALTCGFLKTLPIPVPSRAEQEEIATAFQTIEDKQVCAARKQAALQDLFRTLLHELMTAKIRVTDHPTSVL